MKTKKPEKWAVEGSMDFEVYVNASSVEEATAMAEAWVERYRRDFFAISYDFSKVRTKKEADAELEGA